MEAAAGAGGAAFGSGAVIDIAGLPWLTLPGFAFVTGRRGQPILGSMAMIRAISSRSALFPHAGEWDGIPGGAAPVLDADDGLAAKATIAKLFEYLTGAVQSNR